VCRQQLGPQHLQDKGSDCGLQEEEDRSATHLHKWGVCGEGVQLQVPGHAHGRRPPMSSNTSALVKRAQQRLHFLRVLRRIDLKRELLTVFYTKRHYRGLLTPPRRSLAIPPQRPLQHPLSQEGMQHSERQHTPRTPGVSGCLKSGQID